MSEEALRLRQQQVRVAPSLERVGEGEGGGGFCFQSGWTLGFDVVVIFCSPNNQSFLRTRISSVLVDKPDSASSSSAGLFVPPLLLTLSCNVSHDAPGAPSTLLNGDCESFLGG